MKKNFRIIIMAIAIVFVAVSCGKGKSSEIDVALSQFEKAMDKIENNKTSLTEADWKALNKEIEKPAKVLNSALENSEISELKKLKISAAMLRYASAMGEVESHSIAESLKMEIEDQPNLPDSISVAVRKLKAVLESNELKESLQELQKAIDDLQKIKL